LEQAIHRIPPFVLPAFPGARKVRGTTWFAGGLRRRWTTTDGLILEWDYQPGTIEVYDSRGRHVGEFDPTTGQPVGPANPARKVEP
jgi:hypothetical protein